MWRIRCHGWSHRNIWGGWEGDTLEEALTEADISFLNEGLNGTPPSKDWNYCHTELQIEFK